MDNQLENKKAEVTRYEKEMDTKIIQLNNQIANLNKKFEDIDIKKSKLKNEEEETSSKQLAKISELSRIFMAVENLEQVCNNRKKGNTHGLQYKATELYSNIVKELKNFDSFS